MNVDELMKLRDLAKAVCGAAEECESADGRAYLVQGDDLDALADYLNDMEESMNGGAS